MFASRAELLNWLLWVTLVIIFVVFSIIIRSRLKEVVRLNSIPHTIPDDQFKLMVKEKTNGALFLYLLMVLAMVMDYLVFFLLSLPR